jgi:hypothetical protein
MDEGYSNDVEIDFGWDSSLEKNGVEAEWAPTACAHCAGLDLAQALKTTKTIGRDMKNFNRVLKKNIQGPDDVKSQTALQHLI